MRQSQSCILDVIKELFIFRRVMALWVSFEKFLIFGPYMLKHMNETIQFWASLQNNPVSGTGSKQRWNKTGPELKIIDVWRGHGVQYALPPMFEIFRIKKYVKGKIKNKRREIVGKILKLEIFFSPRGTAVSFSPALPSLPFHQTPLEPCVSVFTTLEGIQLCKEKSHWDESLFHEF